MAEINAPGCAARARMSSRICTLLLAAGAARRYGAVKQLEKIDGVSLVRRTALAALDAGTQLLVVTGAHAEDVETELRDLPLRCVRNEAWSEGMGSSLACGARALMAQVQAPDAALILLSDQAMVGAAELRELLDQHSLHPQAIIAADHGATLGPPCLFPARCFTELAALQGDRGARALLKAHQANLVRVAMPQAGVDIDTKEDLQKLITQRG